LDGIQDRQIQIVLGSRRFIGFSAHVIGARRKWRWNSAGSLRMNRDLSSL
jgi:hypothetical protein